MSARRTNAALSATVLFVALLTFAAAWPQGLPAAPAESVGMSAQKLGRIAETFRKEIDQGRLPGAVFLVARKGKLVYSDAIGLQIKETGKPMPKDAIFRIYSMTKPIVSVAAFAKVMYTLVPADREMTVQDLLRHTAGLAYGELTQNTPVKEALGKAGIYKTTIDFDSRDLPPAEQVERMSKVPLAHQPGTVWEYSLASDLLGRVVEAASGERLADFLERRLFKPLKMNDTGFWVPKEKLGRLAEPLLADAATGKASNLMDVSAVPANDSGGAGGVSTAADYLRFTQMLLNGGQLDGARVLSRSSVALMTSDHLGTRISAPVTPGELLLGV